MAEAAALRAVERGFAEIAWIHALMSFHAADSDLMRLNRGAAQGPVAVDPETWEVMSRALEIAAASGGAFDPTVAGELVRWGYLPAPSEAPPDPKASWRDVELVPPNRIRFHRPLWVDFGGIAKGYAVDRAMAAMGLAPGLRCRVDAGGDLKVQGPGVARVLLRTDDAPGETAPVIELENGSLASSSGRRDARRIGGRPVGPHLDGVRRKPVGARTFVSVAAESCLVADALTKVVLARGRRAASLLGRYGAIAYLQTARSGWRVLGEAG